jgi:hypothetical protein
MTLKTLADVLELMRHRKKIPRALSRHGFLAQGVVFFPKAEGTDYSSPETR